MIKVFSGAETASFKSRFRWAPAKLPAPAGGRKSVGIAAGPDVLSADELAKSMSARAADRDASSEHREDEGSGRLQVWRIEDMERAPVDESQHGQLFDGDSYIMLYSYAVSGREAHYLYFWQGNQRCLELG